MALTIILQINSRHNRLLYVCDLSSFQKDFSQSSAIRATCQDFRCIATIDYEEDKNVSHQAAELTAQLWFFGSNQALAKRGHLLWFFGKAGVIT